MPLFSKYLLALYLSTLLGTRDTLLVSTTDVVPALVVLADCQGRQILDE